MNQGRQEEASRLASRAFDASLQAGAARTLLLDLDGTLAPIVAHPDLARVPPATRDALRALRAAAWRVVVVSGRPRRDASALVSLPELPVFGSHGLEGPGPGDEHPLAPGVAERLAALEQDGRRLAESVTGVLVERKAGSVAFGHRLVAPAGRAEWKRRLAGFLSARDLSGLELLHGRAVLEVRAREANKSRALRALGLPGSDRLDESLLALGDDRTDEDLFAAIAGQGLGVLVGRPRATRATHRLASPAAVGRFLGRLAALSCGQTARGGSP